MRKRILWIGFGLYCCLMLWLLFGQRISAPVTYQAGYGERLPWSFNLLPFQTIKKMLSLLEHGEDDIRRFAMVNLGGNVGMFLPLGIFLPALWKKQRKFWRFLPTTLLTILAVELLQMFTCLGSGDVDDLLLNVLGASIGHSGWSAMEKTRRKRTRRTSPKRRKRG